MTPTIASFIANAFLVLLLITGYFLHEHIVDNLEKEKAMAIAQATQDQLELDNKNNKPANEANNEGKKNDDNLLDECLSSLQHYQTNSAMSAGNAASGAKTAYQIYPQLKTSTVSQIFCKRENEDLNVAKSWATNCTKQGLCN